MTNTKECKFPRKLQFVQWFSLSSTKSILPTALSFLLIFSYGNSRNGISGTDAIDPVYIRSNSFGQLVTSSTLRWVKGQDKYPVTLESGQIICRVTQAGLKEIGLLSLETGECNINSEEDPKVVTSSRSYQTLSGQAARVIWTAWARPNPPPTNAVSVAEQQKFIAIPTDSSNTVGHLDTRLNLGGSAIFPQQDISLSDSAQILVEIDPERYELYDIELKKVRGFIEEEIVLVDGKLIFENPETGKTGLEYADREDGKSEESEYEDSDDKNQIHRSIINHHHNRLDELGTEIGRIESILAYEEESKDYWGNGMLMAKGLQTYIHLPDGWTPRNKIIEWGLPLQHPRKTETMTIAADLLRGTGVNVTIKGTKLDGEMTYWATLKTYYKDGSYSTRLIEGVRKLKEVNNTHMVLGKPYFLQNGLIVPEPTTTTTTTTTTTSTARSTSSSSTSESSSSVRGERDKSQEKMLSDGSETRADKSTSSFAFRLTVFTKPYLILLAFFCSLPFLKA